MRSEWFYQQCAVWRCQAWDEPVKDQQGGGYIAQEEKGARASTRGFAQGAERKGHILAISHMKKWYDPAAD